MYKNFLWILMILYIQWILIFTQIHTICTFNVHNFSFNFHDFVLSTEIKFLNKSRLSVHLMYTIFHWIFLIWFVHWFSIEFSRICWFNKFDFFYKSEQFVHLMYIIFHWILTILYFQQNQISQQSRLFVHLMYTNFPLNFHDLVCSSIFHRIFMNLYIQPIWIFLLFQKIVRLTYKIFHC